MPARLEASAWLPWMVFVLAIFPFVVQPRLDIEFVGSFYTAGRWTWRGHPLLEFFYRCGPGPGLLVAVPSLLIWIGSYAVPRLRRLRVEAGFLAASAALGPWILTNLLFKEFWGRPRPLELDVFGGTQTFVPFGVPGLEFSGHSFPSGHAAMAFFPLALAFVAWSRGRRRWANVALLVGFTCGTLVGVTRVMAGAHFLSDIVGSATIVWLTCWALSPILKRR